MDIEDFCSTKKGINGSKKVILDKIVKELIAHQDSLDDQRDVEVMMQYWGRRLKHIVSKNEIRTHYQSYPENFSPPMSRRLSQLLVKRAVRSRSGILNISVVLPPHRFSCKYDCAFCPKEPGMPRSYLSNEDAVARANHVDFDPIQQVFSRLDTLNANGHPLDKIEFRLLGGTFSSYPHDITESFIRDLYYAVNVYPNQTRSPKSLSEEIDEQSGSPKIHVVGLGLETRPDAITIHELERFRSFGCTRVELGVQHTDDDLLRICRRGHGLRESKRAIQLLKDHGFKVEMHIMIDLPGATPEKDRECYKKILQDDPDLFPDYLKDYPCLDVSFTEIKKWKECGKWTPYADKDKDAKTLRNVLVYRQLCTPPFVRVNRIQRDFALAQEKTHYLGYTSNTISSNLGQIVRKDAESQGIYCQCIRCCEVREEVCDPKMIKLDILVWRASHAYEYFIRAIIPRTPRPLLLGFVRLRITDGAELPELLGKIALIRELHVYGRVETVGSNDQGGVQHQGIGKRLMDEAEKIAFDKHRVSRVAVIAGVGVRQYYAKRGYVLDGTYMIRERNPYAIFNFIATCTILETLAYLYWMFWRLIS